jgi:hypothetical protein
MQTWTTPTVDRGRRRAQLQQSNVRSRGTRGISQMTLTVVQSSEGPIRRIYGSGALGRLVSNFVTRASVGSNAVLPVQLVQKSQRG